LGDLLAKLEATEGRDCISSGDYFDAATAPAKDLALAVTATQFLSLKDLAFRSQLPAGMAREAAVRWGFIG
jgi:hypothetical protein